MATDDQIKEAQRLAAELNKLYRSVGATLKTAGKQGIDQMKDAAGRYADLLTQQEKTAALTIAQAERAQSDLEVAQERLIVAQAMAKAIGEETELAQELITSAEDYLKRMTKVADKLDEQGKKANKVVERLKKADQIANDIGSRFMGITSETESWKDAIFGSKEGLKDSEGIIRKVGRRLKKNLDFSFKRPKLWRRPMNRF